MNNFAVYKGEKFFAAVLFAVENLPLVVRHWSSKKVIKIPGGTYNPKGYAQNEKEEREYYDNTNREEVSSKLKNTISRMLGENLQKVRSDTIENIVNDLIEKYFNQPVAIQAIIEYIEETGIIPTVLEEFESQFSGIRQFFYRCYMAIAYSKEKELFIEVKSIDDIPKRAIDFTVQDPEVKNTFLLKNINPQKYNFAHAHIAVLMKYFKTTRAA